MTKGDDGNKSWDVATTENADLFIQPIVEEDGGITHQRGGFLKRETVGGLKIGEDPPPLADAVRPIRTPVWASPKLARALFNAVLTKEYDPVESIAVAAEWHRSALANPPAVTMQQRLIALKTGFEALFKTSSSAKCAKKLRALFDDVTRPRKYRDLLPWTGLLWSPGEKQNLWRWYWLPTGQREIERRNEIQDWFMTLADARNDVIHRGSLSKVEYEPPPERPQSAYVGSLFWVGERMLREAIKARLGADILLCGRIAERAFANATFGPWVKQTSEDHAIEGFAGCCTAQHSEPPPRELAALLELLGCAAASLVTIARSTDSIAMTDEAGSSFQYEWSAKYAEHSTIAITTGERDLLTKAGGTCQRG